MGINLLPVSLAKLAGGVYILQVYKNVPIKLIKESAL